MRRRSKGFNTPVNVPSQMAARLKLLYHSQIIQSLQLGGQQLNFLHSLRWRAAASVFVCLMVLFTGMMSLHAQENAGSIQGVVLDPRGLAVQGATVVIANAASVQRTV